ncbi:ribokinase [Fontisphaera persica]|uniref:ribokinase n=1 Tax=Fontisphaera persica TaxID=2974023 RepID=UPI0024BF7D49|nr:ribokinase [Fontisphaera persica]WCJ59864.1 ribokinase [Fontisphaera persica]
MKTKTVPPPRIVVVGSSNTDMVVQTPRIPRPGETLLGGRFTLAAGGKGANQAVAAARAGGRVAFVCRLGRDWFGDQALQGFKADGVETRWLVRDAQEPSGVALIAVAADGENSIVVAPGANRRLSRHDVAAAVPAIQKARVVLAQLEVPLAAVQATVRQARKAGAMMILNPAPAQPLPESLLRQIHLLTPNETEAEILTGVKVDSPRAAAKAALRLRQRGVESVLVTLGARGVWVASGAESAHVPGFKVRAVDTTAAGDVFNGALAVALAEGQALLPAVRFAQAAAALSVTRLGAQPSAPYREEIERFLRQHADE